MSITPNQITAIRVGMAFAAVALFGRELWSNLAALGLTVTAIALDGVDGYLARRYRLATRFGAQLDILGDRVIENLFFTYFAVCGLVSLWVPIVFFVRGALTDFIRGLAARSERPAASRAAFSKNWMLESRWGQALVASKSSRATYGALKCVCFCYLGLQLTLLRDSATGLALLRNWTDVLLLGSGILVWATVAFCLLRGLPVVWEGRRYFTGFIATRRTAVGVAAR